jgi:signal transduction histidine kinase
MSVNSQKTKKTAAPIKKEEINPLSQEPLPVKSGNPQEREFLFKNFHDMRNPLHAIMGYTSLVLRKTRNQISEKHQENLEKVLQSAEKLKEIVDQMVAFYRDK